MSDVDHSPDSEAGDLDLASRELCSDGACTGVIGDDGHCRMCGRLGDHPVAQSNPDEAAAESLETSSVTSPESSERGEWKTLAGEDDPDFAERRLCPDGACIGVLGPDGHCKVCGQAA